MFNAAEQVLDFARTHFRLGILQRHCAAQTELRHSQPLTGIFLRLQNFDCLAHEPGETHDPVGFSLIQPTPGFPTMERSLGDAEHGEEFFHRHIQAGLQVVQLLNRQTDPERFDQFGRSKIRGRDFAGCAMHTIADYAATGLFDAPLAAFAVDDHRARGFLRRLLGQGIAHLILLIVSFATGVNSLLDQGTHRRPHSRRAFQPALRAAVRLNRAGPDARGLLVGVLCFVQSDYLIRRIGVDVFAELLEHLNGGADLCGCCPQAPLNDRQGLLGEIVST